jgi:transposase-like protein
VEPKSQKMHKDKRLAIQNGVKASKKVAVMGTLERDSRQVRAKVVPNVKREALQREILNEIEHGSKVYTDRWVGYENLQRVSTFTRP